MRCTCLLDWKGLKDRSLPRCHIKFSYHVSLGSSQLWHFLRFSLVLMTLTVLRCIGQLLCRHFSDLLLRLTLITLWKYSLSGFSTAVYHAHIRIEKLFAFRPPIHFYLILMKGAMTVSMFFFFHMQVQFFWHHLLKWHPFSIEILLLLCQSVFLWVYILTLYSVSLFSMSMFSTKPCYLD